MDTKTKSIASSVFDLAVALAFSAYGFWFATHLGVPAWIALVVVVVAVTVSTLAWRFTQGWRRSALVVAVYLVIFAFSTDLAVVGCWWLAIATGINFGRWLLNRKRDLP